MELKKNKTNNPNGRPTEYTEKIKAVNVGCPVTEVETLKNFAKTLRNKYKKVKN